MALPSSNQPGSSSPRPIAPRPTAPKPPPPKDKSVFSKGEAYVPLGAVRNRWRGQSSFVPGSSRTLSQAEKFSVIDRVRKESRSSHTTKQQVQSALKKLSQEKSGKSASEQAKIADMERFAREEFFGSGK